MRRIQKRLGDITDVVPPNAFFAISAGKIADGLTEQIENFVSDYPDTVFIAIDTLQMVRNSDSDSSYANDYSEISVLKNLVDRLDLSLLLVHHLRKQGDNDPLNRLSGTTGISGAVDSVFILEKGRRSQKNATLICTGRDIEDRELDLSMNKDTHRWELMADSVDDPSMLLPPDVSLFSEFMFCISRFDGSNTDLAELYNKETGKKITAKALKQMMNNYRFELENLGVFFESRRTNGKRLVKVWHQSDESVVSDANIMCDTTSKAFVSCVPCDPVSELSPNLSDFENMEEQMGE